MDEADPAEARIDALSRVELLDGMRRDHIVRFAERCSFRRIAAGATLASEGLQSNSRPGTGPDGATDAFLVLEGRLVARSRSRQGREITFASVGPGGLFGEFSAIDGAPRSAEIVAVEPSWVAQLTSERLREMMIVLPQTGLRLCELLVAKNREMSQRLFEFATLTVSQRLYATLIRLARSQGCESEGGRIEVSMPPTQYELAVMVGTHRESVSREMSALARDGLVAYDRRTLTVLDIEALARRIDGNGPYAA